MGAVPTSLGRTLGLKPEGSVSETKPDDKERSEMSRVNIIPAGHASRSPLQKLHVYRHVDSEKVECNPSLGPDASKTLALPYKRRSPNSLVVHGEHSPSAEHSTPGAWTHSC
jgi:hypothetical protein